ncbi:uncharacterized protein UV8b_03353 [Ustilaginoidea virens]|uniref:Subtilisin-like serine protease PR1C n=1 Tax=Ustilaginoidea virens TaxID=1159556 RepID=A0A8E5MGN7_USTVR|nr:uncharacterized protein UV8b_03353 [Ustilaginoidea virens]QUC19112.1 hypothetical protein UV8b_03353 [Ustilaginoidea virens]
MVRASVLASLVAAAASTLADKAKSDRKVSRDILSGAYIIELHNGQDHSSVEQSIGKDGATRMKFNYELFNGLSVQMHDHEKAKDKAAQLAALPAVKAVYPVKLYPQPNPKVDWVAPPNLDSSVALESLRVAQDTFSPHVMTQVDKLHAKGITGKDTKLAVIDTGIDYLTAGLGGCFGKGCLVSFGTDLVGDSYNGNNTPEPDPDPMDCAGHGTHVAGIVAAQPNRLGFTGVAPGVHLGAYRVFGCNGTVSSDVLIAAYNQAYQDGANIITCSVGSDGGWPEDRWAEAVSRIVEKGVPCVLSAGNSGDQGLFFADDAADGRRATAVASFNNIDIPTLYYNAQYQIDGGADSEFKYASEDEPNWLGVALPVWASSLDPTVADDGCKPFPADTPDLSKHIVLIRRGTCFFAEKMANAVAKGAQYIILYNNVRPGALNVGRSDATGPPPKAAAMIDAATGESFIKVLKAGKKLTLKLPSRLTVPILVSEKNSLTGGALSEYTSWGPTWEMAVKPQYGAPGGNILSTWPRSKGGFAVLSGTSMAAPHVAGIIALIHQVRGTYDPGLVQDLISANANPQVFNDKTKFYDFLAPIPQQGAGLVQAYDAAYATTLLSPSSLSFNDTDHFAKELKFELKSVGHGPTTYKITHVPAITMYTLAKNSNYALGFPNEAVHAAATLKFSDTSITLQGHQTKTVAVSAIPPQGLDFKRLALWSGYIAINGSDGTSLSLPYQGLTGSLFKSTVLAANDTWVSKSTDEEGNPLPPGYTFVLPMQGIATNKDLLPQITINQALGSSIVRADVVPITPSLSKMTTEHWGVRTIGQPFGFPILLATRSVRGYLWDGRLDSGAFAPPGEYKFVVRALRIFGDARKKEDWDVSTTTSIIIKYKQ